MPPSPFFQPGRGAGSGSGARKGADAGGPGAPAQSFLYDIEVAADGPALWWKLNDPAGSAEAADSSGDRWYGHLPNGGVTFGQQPGAVAGDTSVASLASASSGIVSSATGVGTGFAGFSPSGWTGLTVEAWVNLNGLSQSGTPRALATSHTDLDNKGFQLISSGSQTAFNVGNGTTNAFVSGSGLPASGWTYLAGTWDGTTVTLYVNGVSAATGSLTGTLAQGIVALGAGGNASYSGDFLNGLLAQVAVYSYALTAARIKAHFSAAQMAAFPQPNKGISGRRAARKGTDAGSPGAPRKPWPSPVQPGKAVAGRQAAKKGAALGVTSGAPRKPWPSPFTAPPVARGRPAARKGTAPGITGGTPRTAPGPQTAPFTQPGRPAAGRPAARKGSSSGSPGAPRAGIAFPNAPGDTSTASGASPLVLTPPANTVTGDLLLFSVISRNGFSSEPAGLTRLSEFATNGTFATYVYPVTNAASMPASWSWTPGSTRAAGIVIRVTGADLNAPVVYPPGGTAGAGSDQGFGTAFSGALPLQLPGTQSLGGLVAFIGTFWTGDGDVPPLTFVPGLAQRATLTTPAAGVGRSSQAIHAFASPPGPSGTITCGTWATPTGQDGILIGLQAAPGPASFTQPGSAVSGKKAARKGAASGAAGKFTAGAVTPSPFTQPHQAVRGKAAARKGVTGGSAGAPRQPWPSPFTAPQVVRGHPAALTGQASQSPGAPASIAPFRQPQPVTGHPAARKGRAYAPAPFTPVQPARFTQPQPVRGRAPLHPGTAHGSNGAPRKPFPSPFRQPSPARGCPAARKGGSAGSPGAKYVFVPVIPAPFLPPHQPVRGKAAAVKGTRGGSPGAPVVAPRLLHVSLGQARLPWTLGQARLPWTVGAARLPWTAGQARNT